MLALETSTMLGSLAVGTGSELWAESMLSVRAQHSETILDEASRLLERAGIAPADLEAVAVGAGPGSFTGVRIAASLAKGLCFAHDLPLFSFSSLWAVAASLDSSPLCALFDARRGEVYAATFHDVHCPPEMGPLVMSMDVLLDRLDPVSDWTFAGEGAEVHRRTIHQRGGRVLPAHLGVPRASGLLWLAANAAEHGRVEDRGLWEPEYVRASGAERGVGQRV